VLGWAEFCGLRIAVDPGVFVPRRRTEFLVSQAITLASRAPQPATQLPATDWLPATAQTSATNQPPATNRPPTADQHPTTAQHPTADQHLTTTQPGSGDLPRAVVVDLCCGSGALGVAVAAALGQVDLHAADLDPVAVRCARRNVAAVGGHVYEGDLYQPLPAALRGRVGILIANAPYVPTGEVALLPPEARLHEPQVALGGGADGLDILRRVAGEAAQWLAPGGHLLSETSERQAPRLADAMARAGLVPRVARSAELNATVIIGTYCPQPGPP
jgi:release factor glutamine methyltransferase